MFELPFSDSLLGSMLHTPEGGFLTEEQKQRKKSLLAPPQNSFLLSPKLCCLPRDGPIAFPGLSSFVSSMHGHAWGTESSKAAGGRRPWNRDGI